VTNRDTPGREQDSQTVARPNGAHLAAFRGFEADLERALGDLLDRIGAITPDQYVELLDDVLDDEEIRDRRGRRIVTVTGPIVNNDWERVEHAFAEALWPLWRAAAVLRKALGQ
jgi:hypothetical protein